MADQDLRSIEAPASMDNWEKLSDFVDEVVTEHVGDKGKNYKLRLATEELISNILRAADDAKKTTNKNVQLKLSVKIKHQDEKKWFVLESSDDGNRFDPQFGKRKPVDTAQNIRERDIGGLGLFLIEQSVDRVSYDWIDGQNTYELWVEIT